MQISNVNVYGLENAIRVSKFPMAVNVEDCTCETIKTTSKLGSCKSGSGHDNYIKGIIVQFDMRFSNKMSVELERYHFIDFISSQSTMHRITKFMLEDQCNEFVDQRVIDIVQEMIDVYNGLEDKGTEFAKDLYLRILYNIPSGFELTAGFTTNYQQLKTIYWQRRNHRLPEWRAFCKWVETLPKFGELVLGGEK
ncbi:hypothetical protein [Lacrimispora sp.]|uniref:hypothetical protein n=1 Tax=Lacrimispora sp. TaxID=2719234 RepID=UPI0028AE8F60|nr:hypothetical protein [Lacrimispora sp.]